jgi:hypothetical protein
MPVLEPITIVAISSLSTSRTFWLHVKRFLSSSWLLCSPLSPYIIARETISRWYGRKKKEENILGLEIGVICLATKENKEVKTG